MAIWGKKHIKLSKYLNSPILYYEYNTVSDTFLFIQKGIDDYTGDSYETKHFLSDETGRGMMEAFISHIIAMDGIDEKQFMEKYVKNNRFTRKD